MIRRLCYGTIFTLFLSCALVSLITGAGGVHEFEVTAPDDFLEYATFVPGLLVDLVQFMFSCVSWDFVPGLPVEAKAVLIPLSTLPLVVVFFMDFLEPISAAVGKLLDAIIPG